MAQARGPCSSHCWENLSSEVGRMGQEAERRPRSWEVEEAWAMLHRDQRALVRIVLLHPGHLGCG